MEVLRTTAEDSFFVGTINCSDMPHHLFKLEDACIFFCHSGEARIEIDLLEYDITPNTQIIFLPNSIINYSYASPDLSISYITFSNAFFQEATVRLDPSFFHFLKENPVVTLPVERTRTINGLIIELEDLYKDKENCFRLQILRNYIQSFLLDIYDKTHRIFEQNRPEGISRQEELFKRFIQLIHKHCLNQREVSFYAQKMFITPRYLSAITQAVAGETAKNIIDKHVILEIKVLLESTDLSIQEIANRLQFPDQSFFGRYFKKHTSISPQYYRRKLG
ncbi:AraC family transcriptional regulator [Parabacteroides merdae]|uniref:AraC family transcriptional regulator n=1 Tax=Parabacteroides merdae TaxID=46503 RepID=UPI0035644880